MRLSILCCFALCVLPAAADSKTATPPAPNKTPAKTPAPAAAPKTAAEVPPTPAPPPAPTPAAPPPPAKVGITLDNYMGKLNDELALSKDEQIGIMAYYQEDGAKLHGILNDLSLSPMDQQQQVDNLRHVRNAKIEALLKDVDRQSRFAALEPTYRVDLVELAAEGGLTPKAPPPNVPEPATPATAPANKTAPGV